MYKEKNFRSSPIFAFLIGLMIGCCIVSALLLVEGKNESIIEPPLVSVIYDTVCVVDTVEKVNEIIKYLPPTIKTVYKTHVDTVKTIEIVHDTVAIFYRACPHDNIPKRRYIRTFNAHRYPDSGTLWELDSILECK